jgi:hypothetical protein
MLQHIRLSFIVMHLRLLGGEIRVGLVRPAEFLLNFALQSFVVVILERGKMF